MNDSIDVYLHRCSEYDSDKLSLFFETCLAKAARTSFRSAKILVKPNLLSAKMGGLACTDTRFVVALCEWLRQKGAVVAVGDSPAFGRASSVLQALGVAGTLGRLGVSIVDFERVVTKSLPCGVDVGIGAEIFDYDFFINAPKLKAHSQMFVTMAVKNIFGIVVGVRKSLLHMRHGGSAPGFSSIILDLQTVLPPHASIMDGIVAMHRQGPVLGEPLPLGCVGFSVDPVALDTAILKALRLDAARSPLWRLANERELAGSRIENIRFPDLEPSAFYDRRFIAPDQLSPIRFNPVRFTWNNLKRTALYLRRR